MTVSVRNTGSGEIRCVWRNWTLGDYGNVYASSLLVLSQRITWNKKARKGELSLQVNAGRCVLMPSVPSAVNRYTHARI